MTAFSEFIRNASIEEKKSVYDKVIKESCLAQRRAGYWFVDAEGVKRWADNNEQVESTKSETELKD